MEIKIPNLGDGVDSAVVISILVKPGDSVSKDQTIIELETDKAIAPVPSPSSGTIADIIVKEGDTLRTGTLIGHFVSEGSDSKKDQPSVSAPVTASAQTLPVSPVVNPVPTASVPVAPVVPVDNAVVPPCAPSLKKLAFRIGLDLTKIAPSGPNGRLLDIDVFNYIQYLQSLTLTAQTTEPKDAPKKVQSLPDFSKFGPVSTTSLSSLRQKISDKMQLCWTTIPHVTQQQQVDITNLMVLRKKYNQKIKKFNTKITLTVLACRALQKALQAFPQFNASYDEAKQELIIKSYYNMGVAVDTEAGLIVPVIKDVDKKSIVELCHDLDTIAEKARTRTLSATDLQGSSFTISNLGGLGVGAFTPIVNAPEVAIIGIGSGDVVPRFDEKGNVVKKLMMPICLSYDHRVIDGADGARFINKIRDEFEQFDEAELKEIK